MSRRQPSLAETLGEIRTRVDSRLDELVPRESEKPELLHQAIRYSLTAPGKRVRPALTILAATVFRGSIDLALDPACAVELVHTASLILDDLPSMDDATLRRGRKANHLVFGEDLSILAAFALLNRAFSVVSESAHLSLRTRSDLAAILSRAIGSEGVVAGQTVDLRSTAQTIDFETLEYIHSRKTGALFIASAEMGAAVAGLSGKKLEPIHAYAKNLGLAFQILDDLLDLEGTAEQTGKTVQQDVKKTTFVSFSGASGARSLASELVTVAVDALRPYGRRADPLRELARSLLRDGVVQH